ncbi:hypothetical protein C8Q75DRAFT_805868 [Abortiporus biennis]|nr:hypothetical protein C8Q75DRAFT_805868 [Abortiporus biennis]
MTSTSSESQFTIDLGKEVQFLPSSAWTAASVTGSQCSGSNQESNATSRLTTHPGASASFMFKGSRFVIHAFKSNVSGIMQVKYDNQSYFTDLVDSQAHCEAVVDERIGGNSTHRVTLSLYSDGTTSTSTTTTSTASSGVGNVTSTNSSQLPQFNLLQIVYYVPTPSTSVQPSGLFSSNFSSGSQLKIPVPAIVFIIIGGLVAISFIVLRIFKRTLRLSLARKWPPVRIRVLSTANTTTSNSITHDQLLPNLPQAEDAQSMVNVEGMTEHRTATTLSYGRTPHYVSPEDHVRTRLVSDTDVEQQVPDTRSYALLESDLPGRDEELPPYEELDPSRRETLH